MKITMSSKLHAIKLVRAERAKFKKSLRALEKEESNYQVNLLLSEKDEEKVAFQKKLTEIQDAISARKVTIEKLESFLKDRRNEMTQPFQNGFQRITSFCQHITRPISRFVMLYGRLLRRLFVFIIGIALLICLRANNPAAFENVPAIDGLLNSAEIFVEWVSKFLTWHFELLKDFIDAIATKIG